MTPGVWWLLVLAFILLLAAAAHDLYIHWRSRKLEDDQDPPR
jgi:hypothetical protein